MMETGASILVGLAALIAVGAAIVVYVVWRSRRRMDDAAAEMAAEARRAGGPDGPTGPV